MNRWKREFDCLSGCNWGSSPLREHAEKGVRLCRTSRQKRGFDCVEQVENGVGASFTSGRKRGGVVKSLNLSYNNSI